MSETALVLGAHGLLGTEVRKQFEACGFGVEAPDKREVDVTNDLDLHPYFLHTQASIVVNCAAYTKVDAAETERDAAFALNAGAAFNIARYCTWRGMKLIHLSTDFVFDGETDQPYRESDPTHPISVYGESKLHGETLVMDKFPKAIIVRTSWLFGTSGNCFPKTVMRAAKQGKPLHVVNDQIGSPTYAKDLAAAIVSLASASVEGGMYHVANAGRASWHDLAVECLNQAGIRAEVVPIATHEWPAAARRPRFSVLDCSKYASLGLKPMPDWRDAVARFVNEEADL